MPGPTYSLSTATDAKAVTKSDATVIAPPFRALYVGGAGDVAILTLDGTTTTFVGVPAGGYVLCAGTKVMSANTTATGIVALY